MFVIAGKHREKLTDYERFKDNGRRPSLPIFNSFSHQSNDTTATRESQTASRSRLSRAETPDGLSSTVTDGGRDGGELDCGVGKFSPATSPQKDAAGGGPRRNAFRTGSATTGDNKARSEGTAVVVGANGYSMSSNREDVGGETLRRGGSARSRTSDDVAGTDELFDFLMRETANRSKEDDSGDGGSAASSLKRRRRTRQAAAAVGEGSPIFATDVDRERTSSPSPSAISTDLVELAVRSVYGSGNKRRSLPVPQQAEPCQMSSLSKGFAAGISGRASFSSSNGIAELLVADTQASSESCSAGRDLQDGGDRLALTGSQISFVGEADLGRSLTGGAKSTTDVTTTVRTEIDNGKFSRRCLNDTMATPSINGGVVMRSGTNGREGSFKTNLAYSPDDTYCHKLLDACATPGSPQNDSPVQQPNRRAASLTITSNSRRRPVIESSDVEAVTDDIDEIVVYDDQTFAEPTVEKGENSAFIDVTSKLLYVTTPVDVAAFTDLATTRSFTDQVVTKVFADYSAGMIDTSNTECCIGVDVSGSSSPCLPQVRDSPSLMFFENGDVSYCSTVPLNACQKITFKNDGRESSPYALQDTDKIAFENMDCNTTPPSGDRYCSGSDCSNVSDQINRRSRSSFKARYSLLGDDQAATSAEKQQVVVPSSTARCDLETRELDSKVQEFQSRTALEREAMKNRLRKLTMIYSPESGGTAARNEASHRQHNQPSTQPDCLSTNVECTDGEGRHRDLNQSSSLDSYAFAHPSTSDFVKRRSTEIKSDTESLSSNKDEGFESECQSDPNMSSSQRSSVCMDGDASLTPTLERKDGSGGGQRQTQARSASETGAADDSSDAASNNGASYFARSLESICVKLEMTPVEFEEVDNIIDNADESSCNEDTTETAQHSIRIIDAAARSSLSSAMATNPKSFPSPATWPRWVTS